MKYFDDVKFPSVAFESASITEESVYRAADELLKSHLYSAKTALPCTDNERLIIWLDYDFFCIKKKARKVCCDRIKISDDGRDGEKKTRKYFYHELEGDVFALLPAFQAFSFVCDKSYQVRSVFKIKEVLIFAEARIEVLRTAGDRGALLVS